MNKTNNNIENEINFSCSSLQQSPQQCIIHGNKLSFYASDNDKNAWVYLEFKKHQILPTYYTIGSSRNDYYIRSWALEGSNDNSNWTVIDSQENCEYLRGDDRIHTFKIQN